MVGEGRVRERERFRSLVLGSRARWLQCRKLNDRKAKRVELRERKEAIIIAFAFTFQSFQLMELIKGQKKSPLPFILL